MNRKKLKQKRSHIARRRAMTRCPECGEKSMVGHYIKGCGFLPERCFWICDKFYGPDGLRIAS